MMVESAFTLVILPQLMMREYANRVALIIP